MTGKEVGLIAGIIAVAGAVYYLFVKSDIKSSPPIIEKVYSIIEDTRLANVSDLADEVAKNVIDAHTGIVDKTQGLISHVGDLGDAIRVKEEDMEAYISRLNTTFGGMTPDITQVSKAIDEALNPIVSATGTVVKNMSELPQKTAQSIYDMYANRSE